MNKKDRMILKQIRFSRAQLEVIYRNAKKQGLSMSAYVRHVIYIKHREDLENAIS